MKKEALRVSTTIPAAPTTLYYAWLASEQHSAMTGSPAKIDSSVGGKFSAWDGYITGTHVILDLGRRIVMSWRTTDFPKEAPDSRCEVHFEALGGSTRLTILHTEIPEGQGEKYREGWNERYFAPMRTFFSKYLPDPRKPPPPRRPIPPPDEDEEEEEEVTPRKGKLLKGKVAPPPSKKVAPPPPSKKVAPPPPSKKAVAPPLPSKKGVAPPPSKKAVAEEKAPKSAKAPEKVKPAAKAAKPAPAKKPPAKAAPKKSAPVKKPAAKKASAPAKKPAAKKPAAKKVAPKKKKK